MTVAVAGTSISSPVPGKPGEPSCPGLGQAVGASRGSPKTWACSSLSQFRGQLQRGGHHVGVGGGEQADWPVGAEHQPGRAEGVEHRLHVWSQACHRPARPPASVTIPDSLQDTLGRVASSGPARPRAAAGRRRWAAWTGGPGRRSPGQRPYGVDRGGQLVRQRQQVVREPGASHRAQAPPHVRTGQPARVRLTLHQVTDARQACAARSRAQGEEHLRNGGRR